MTRLMLLLALCTLLTHVPAARASQQENPRVLHNLSDHLHAITSPVIISRFTRQ